MRSLGFIFHQRHLRNPGVRLKLVTQRVSVFKVCSPASFLQSPVTAWEGLCPVETLRQQKTEAEVWMVSPRGGSGKFLKPAFLGKCSSEWSFLPFTGSLLNYGFPSAAQQK